MLLFTFVMSFSTGLMSRELDFLPIDLEKVSTYDNDRVAFQRVEKSPDLAIDNSFEALLIIKSRKMYLIEDGYDSPYLANIRKIKIAIQRIYGESENDLIWPNRINGKADFVEITDRRVMLMKNSNEEFVSTNFGAFYKSIRDKFIREHVQKFRQLMMNREESNLYVDMKLLPRPLYLTNVMGYKDKYSIVAKAKAYDGTVYTCEDLDGDGITETFTADGNDGFNWGYKSGPNLILIYKNTDKDIETLIGKLANEAVYGGTDEEKEMTETFPKEKDIDDLVKWLTPKNPNLK
jgi:hypothetical protein